VNCIRERSEGGCNSNVILIALTASQAKKQTKWILVMAIDETY
jgi:hypothetical protein